MRIILLCGQRRRYRSLQINFPDTRSSSNQEYAVGSTVAAPMMLGVRPLVVVLAVSFVGGNTMASRGNPNGSPVFRVEPEAKSYRHICTLTYRTDVSSPKYDVSSTEMLLPQGNETNPNDSLLSFQQNLQRSHYPPFFIT